MPDECQLCKGAQNEPPEGWKPSVREDRWQRWQWIALILLFVIALVALVVTIVAHRPSLIGWSKLDETSAATWAQVFITALATALASAAAGIAGFTAIRHVKQTYLTNQLNALIQVWEMVNEKEVTKGRRELYQYLATNQKYRNPETWTRSDIDRVELVANPLDLAGEMVINGLLSPEVVASAYGEVFIRTFAVLQYWIEQERRGHRPKEFKKGLKRMAEWAAVKDQNCRESFDCGHRVQFEFRDDIEENPILCIWKATAPTSSAAG